MTGSGQAADGTASTPHHDQRDHNQRDHTLRDHTLRDHTLRGAFLATLRAPFLRGALLAMVISGVASSLMAPQLSLFLTDDLGASLSVAGLYYLTNISAPVLGWFLGSISDRDGRRLRAYRLASLATAVGWLVTASSTQVWVPFVAATVLLGFGGAAGGQLFAAVREHLAETDRPDAAQITAVIRMGMTGGWIIGPMLGATLGAAFDLRVVLVLAGLGALLQMVPLGLHRDRRAVAVVAPSEAPATTDETTVTPPAATRGRDPGPWPLLFFTLMCVFALTGNTMKYAYLPIFMDKHLGTSPGVFGAVIGTQQTIEFLMMPVCALLASRWGSLRVVTAAAAAGVAANICFATATSVVPLFIGQALVGVMWAAIAALGIVVAQHLWPTRLATASSMFMSASAVASALGGMIGGLAIETMGLPRVFAIPTVLCVLATVGLFAMSRRHPDL